MSFLTDVFQPAAFPLREVVSNRRTALQEVAKAEISKPRTDLPYALTLIGIAGFAFAMYLFLQTQISQGVYLEQSLTQDLRSARADLQELTTQVGVMSAPATLDERARSLGMVPMGAPVFLSLVDGTVLGDAKAAKASSNAPAKVETLNSSSLLLTPDRSALLHVSQIPSDDGAVLISAGEE